MADAFDFTAVIITSGTCDPYNEKVLRASMGSVWHIPLIAVRSMEEVFSFCKINNITTYAMHLKGDELKTGSLVLPAAYMIGNEGNGLSDYAASGCSCLLKIPMPGRAESLNAASAASIIGFASAVRENRLICQKRAGCCSSNFKMLFHRILSSIQSSCAPFAPFFEPVRI